MDVAGAGDMLITPVLELGPVAITGTIVTSWAITAAIGVLAWLLAQRLRINPGLLQTALEGMVSAMEDAVRAVTPVANLSGLIPGVHSPTRDLSATAALAFLVFLSVHWYGIRIQGLKTYLRHYLTPSPIMLPFHLISEITRTIALAVRLFGNMMSLEMAALLILLVAGFLAPVPILMLHIIEALVQAYIFGMLALIYVAGGIQSQLLRQPDKE
jgi:F-type H+-transporting ATPase subunit a